ncbi:MAG: AEC family transporter [Epsilonproteobacteria bacterium]|nr:AEC family transporter [Campylobacterota bacterium]
MNVILSLSGIYFFILLGYLSKRVFQKKLDEKTFVLFSIYFLQPILVFWGLTTQEINTSVLTAPLIFIVAVLVALFFSLIFSLYLFKNQKDRSIATVATVVGNTGNLGIPLGIALFGPESVIYTSIINLANVFLVNSVGVYFYARGSFSVRDSFIKIFKLPPIWFGLAAIAFNLFGLKVPEPLALPMQMGAYATMVIQLSIFGMYLYGVHYEKIEWKLFNVVVGLKFVLIPLIAIGVLHFFTVSDLIYNVILLELLVPLAVMNVNLASLYDCKPTQVAFLIFATSVLFLLYLMVVVGFLFR